MGVFALPAPRPERKIFEEAVPLPIASIASETNRSFGAMGNSDDDADSDMSDDMLEQDGSIGGLSSIAASFQHREEDKPVAKKRVYKPHTPFRASPAISTRDDSDSSGDETEIEGEPKEESPRNPRRARTEQYLTTNCRYDYPRVQATRRRLQQSVHLN